MTYMYSLSAPYGYLNAMADKTNEPIDYSVFTDIMKNYMNMALSRWYSGNMVDRSSQLFYSGLAVYMTVPVLERFTDYLDTCFWPSVNHPLPESLKTGEVANVMIQSNDTLIVEIAIIGNEILTPMERVLQRVCQVVEDKLYEGSHVDPLLLEIYNARKL